LKKLILSAILIFVCTGSFLSAGYSVSYHAENDSVILVLTKEILTVIKDKDYKKLTEYIHPEDGIRFSPYAYIDTANDVTATRSTFRLNAYTNKKRIWGSYDGGGDPIKMTFKEYFKKFVYDVDFLNAEKTTLNTKSSRGSTMNNMDDIYPGCIYTESYFSGFEEKYDGMDWRALRLVYKEYEGKYYLVGIIHDEWTI